MHGPELLTTLAGGLGAALLFGYITNRIGLSPIVGYLLAGVVVGPRTPGFVANSEIANELAEFGVVLLMFGVGLHFNIQELLHVRKLAVPGAFIQCIGSFTLGIGIGFIAGWGIAASILFGLAISFASTVVVTRVLADTDELETRVGATAIGWLIVQDIIAVLALVLIPAFATTQSLSFFSLASVFFVASIKLLAVVAAVTFLGGKWIPRLLQHIAATRSRELFTLAILVLVLGIALLSSQVFGISMALGAFLAGMVVGKSEFSLRAANEALPMQESFAVLFFVSVGMLFNPGVFSDYPITLFCTSLTVLLMTPLIAFTTIIVLGYPLSFALKVSLSFAQIGEFSFIVANLGLNLEIMDETAMHLLVAVSIITISISPLLQWAVDPITSWLSRKSWGEALLTQRKPFSCNPMIHSEPQSQSPKEESESAELANVVIIGFGPVGRTAARLLTKHHIRCTVIEMNHVTISQIRDEGYNAILGDATHAATLQKAGVPSSKSIVLSASTIKGAAEVIRVARELNPDIQILIRTGYVRERSSLLDAGADVVFAGEAEVAMALAEHILHELGATSEQIQIERDKLRTEFN